MSRRLNPDRALAQVRRNQYHHGMRQDRLGGPIEYGQVVTAQRLNDSGREVALGMESLMAKMLREAGEVLADLSLTAPTVRPLPAHPQPFREGV